jgi:hypothetical protein
LSVLDDAHDRAVLRFGEVTAAAGAVCVLRGASSRCGGLVTLRVLR